MGIACFVIKQGHQAKRSLRRYHGPEEGEPECSREGRSYHSTSVEIGTHPLILAEDGMIAPIDPTDYLRDERWPTHCECGFEYSDDDHWQVNQDPIYTAEDGREMTLREAPAGAIWVATWMPEWAGVNGGRGPAYVVKLPDGHEWMPGMNATNCDRKGQDHDCWCVHGEAPLLTVDKNPEPGRTTCSAGAGSIASPGWHGFLTNGELVG